jgi:DNA-binding transcriptional regulator YiaG
MSLIGIEVKNWTVQNTPTRVRAILEREHLTQQELAHVLGVSVSTVARWCTGGKNIPDVRARAAMQRIVEGGKR